jgi:spore coat protein A, manganese oxidase
MITRRNLIAGGLIAGAGLALPKTGSAQMGGGGMGGMGGGMGGGMMGGGTSSPPTTAFQAPLPIPAVVSKETRTDPVTGALFDYCEVTQEVAHQQIIPGLWTEIWGYNGCFPGPTVVAKAGRPLCLRVYNHLPEETATHLHGGHVPATEDGHAMDFVMPETYRDYHYSNNQIAAPLWYHDHTMCKTADHVIRGLAGFYINTDDFEASLPLPKAPYDIGLAIQDRLFNADGSFNYTLSGQTIMRGFTGDVILVNGAVQPYFQVATRMYRFRILNGSNSRQYQLSLSNGKPFIQVGSDLGLLPAPVTRTSMLISPGERLDVVLDFSKYNVGTQIVLKNTLGSGRTADVMRFEVNRKELDNASVPSVLRPLRRIPTTESIRTRRFTLGMRTMTEFTINGLPYDFNHVEATPTLGTTEIWELVNPMGMSHPMHAHAEAWQILDINGRAPSAYDAGWKDVWLVPGMSTVRIIGRFPDYSCCPDPAMNMESYMLHCHILEHDDHGMMTQFKVIDPNAGM